MKRETVDRANEILEYIAKESRYIEELEKIKATLPVLIEVWVTPKERDCIKEMKLQRIKELEKKLEEL